jgi:EPS-associated MarR family transcriptional regulator
MSTSNDIRRQEAQLRVLRHVTEHPDASTRQIAEAVGVSNGAAFYVLRALIDKGLLKAEKFVRAERKSQYLYLLTPKGIAEKMLLTEKFIRIKREQYGTLRVELKALEKELASNAADRLISENTHRASNFWE